VSILWVELLCLLHERYPVRITSEIGFIAKSVQSSGMTSSMLAIPLH